MDSDNNLPDIIDLNDWIYETHPDIFTATKYLSDAHKVRNIWLKVWIAAGKPDIDEFFKKMIDSAGN